MFQKSLNVRYTVGEERKRNTWVLHANSILFKYSNLRVALYDDSHLPVCQLLGWVERDGMKEVVALVRSWIACFLLSWLKLN